MVGLYRILWGHLKEVRTNSRYFFDNARRSESTRMYSVQRTQSGRAFFVFAGQRKYVPAGHAMVFSHQEDSSYGYPPEDSEPYVHDFLSFEEPEGPGIMQEVRARAGSVIPLPRGTESTRLFYECIHRFNERSFRDRYQESARLYEFIMALQSQVLNAHLDCDPVLTAHEFIASGFGSPVTVEDIARSCGLSREHLSRGYTERYGQSPGRALRALRLKSASELLQNTHAPVEQIASRCGYRDPDAFARAFAQETGLKPLAYRQQFTGR